MKTVYCDRCSDIVSHRSELIMAMGFLRIRTYHQRCYLDVLKAHGGYAISGHPLNSRATYVEAIWFLVFGIAIGVITNHWWFLLLALVIPTVRLWAWIRYERNLT